MASGNKGTRFYENANPISVIDLGATLIVAPHQDDESLGCGGTIALLRKANIAVQVVFVSDGSMSHPNSKNYPVEKRIELREGEAIVALETLGVAKDCIHFMRLKDSMVPGSGIDGFNEAVVTFTEIVQRLKPSAIIVPWRRDPHKDHRATWQIVQAALAHYETPIRALEYFIWLWERSLPQDLPQENEATIWQVDITQVASLKQKAIMAHTSQVTNLINDDPEGFMLSPDVLEHFSGNREFFAEGHVK